MATSEQRAQYADADAGLTSPAIDDEVCECGETHDPDEPWGVEFFHWAVSVGPSNEELRGIVSDELLRRGLVTDEQIEGGLAFHTDQWYSMVADLALGVDTLRPHYAWFDVDGEEITPTTAHDGSSYVAYRLSLIVAELTAAIMTIANTGVRLHPTHVRGLQDLLQQTAGVLGDQQALATTPLHPESVDLSSQARFRFPSKVRDSVVFDIDQFDDAFSNEFEAALTDEIVRLDAEMVKGGFAEVFNEAAKNQRERLSSS